MAKLDVYGHEGRYRSWRATVIVDKNNAVTSIEDGLTKANSDILIRYIFDMEIGANVGKNSKKGPRGYMRLNTAKNRLKQILRWLQEKGISDARKTTSKQIMDLFKDIREGSIKTIVGKKYSERSNADYAEVFSSFWHWWMRINRKEGKELIDISEDLNKQKEESKFVWVTKEELDKMLPYFSEDEQVILLFVFDSTIRAPTELMSLRVKDVFQRDGNVWVSIPQEITKTGFSRTLNLLYCGEAVMKYIHRKEARPEDYLFSFLYPAFTNKMQEVAEKVFDGKISQGGEYFKNITLYDLRHSGAIHFRILAQKTKKISLDAIRQRGGWKNFDMLNYYTRFLGLTGEIDKNDLLIDQDKSKLEQEMDDLRSRNDGMERMIKKLVDINMIYLESGTKNTKSKAELRKYLSQLSSGEMRYPGAVEK